MAVMGTATVKIIPEIDPADLDAAMVEAIAVRVAEILATRPLELTKTLHVDTDAGTVTLDGRPLGAYIADEDIDITLRSNGIIRVCLPIMAEHVVVTGTGVTA